MGDGIRNSKKKGRKSDDEWSRSISSRGQEVKSARKKEEKRLRSMTG